MTGSDACRHAFDSVCAGTVLSIGGPVCDKERVPYQLFVGHAPEERVLVQVLHHPVVQLEYVRDGVEQATLAQDVTKLGQPRRAGRATRAQ